MGHILNGPATEYRPAVGSCEDGNELSGSIEC
jgi:hypothetical protein